jgi:hypothetical protein
MAKKKPVRKSKKKPAPRSKQSKKKATPAPNAARGKKKPSRRKAPGTGVTIEVAEVEVIGEPEDVADDEVFPPDYGGSE